MPHDDTFPKLHNAMWPGLVGKGPDSEPPIGLDTMLDLTAKAEVDGVRFDGVDLFLTDPHTSIDSTSDDIRRLADKIATHGLAVGSLVAPVWPAVGGGSAMGSAERAQAFRRTSWTKRAASAANCARSASAPTAWCASIHATGVDAWAADPVGNTKLIAQTFREACDVAEAQGERLAAEGEICWGGMHSWAAMVDTLEQVGQAADAGLPGRHGPHAALHDGLQRPRGTPAAGRLRLGPEGRLPRRPEEAHRRAPAVDE